MEKKKGPFTEEEDQIIILCLKKATSPNISDAMREVSTLTGRSFQSCYQRYITLGRPTLEKIKQKEQNFNDWKLVHRFFYGESEFVKSWVTEDNYNNTFKRDWESLMDLVEAIEKRGYYVMINRWTSIYEDRVPAKAIINVEGDSKKENTYTACVNFVKWLKNKV